jgi:hypothetical protein
MAGCMIPILLCRIDRAAISCATCIANEYDETRSATKWTDFRDAWHGLVAAAADLICDVHDAGTRKLSACFKVPFQTSETVAADGVSLDR